MFQPNYPKAALGLEKEFITALALQKEGRGQFGIRQAATIELPVGLLNPSFTEKNISSPREMLALIEDVCVRAGLQSQKRWSISLPGTTARTAILTLENEPASKAELEEILDWKAESSFGAPAGELRLAHEKISPDKDGKARYFATAVKLSVIDEYETMFETFGWQAGLILPRAVSEANWLIDKKANSDSLLISSQSDGFTALLIRGDEPIVVRNVTCTESETDDEIYRLLMFYNDRLASSNGSFLEKVLVIGKNFNPSRIREISAEALGQELVVLRPEDVGLNIPVSNFSFDDLAAPAGLAALGA
jgi:Tfp pilus assembly PilM family ATPase